jgi:capsid protein
MSHSWIPTEGDAVESLLELQRKLTAALATDAESRTRRHAAFERERAADAEFEKAEPLVRQAHEKAAREHAVAKARFEQTNQAVTSAYFLRVGAGERRDREVNFAHADLIETAPASYAGFLYVLAKWFDEGRHSRYGASAVERVKAIRAAQKRIVELQLDPREDDRADAHIAAITAALPPLVSSR